jgi:hypothetical protein
LLSFAVGGGEVSWGVGGLGVRTGAGSSCESGCSCDDGGGGVVEADLTESGSARVSSVVGSSGCSMTCERLGLGLGLVGLYRSRSSSRRGRWARQAQAGGDDRVRGACCGAESRKRCDRDASSTRHSKSVGVWRNRQRDSGETVVNTEDVGSGQEGVAGARCVVLVLVLVLVLVRIVALGDVSRLHSCEPCVPQATQRCRDAGRPVRSQVAGRARLLGNCALQLCLCQPEPGTPNPCACLSC